MKSDNVNRVYYEIVGIEHFRKDIITKLIGICRVADHPYYGINCYPATIFTNAKVNCINDFLSQIVMH